MTTHTIKQTATGMDGFETVIGLEIHAQIISQSKMFSTAPTQVFGQEPNSCVVFLDIAMPGMLPTLNKECVDQAIRLGLAIDGHINTTSIMDRKHYFYPDNPAGYQISQYRYPLVENGILEIQPKNCPQKTIRIQRIHIEQDAGKSLHDQDPTSSYVDYNRAGIGLMEIVTHPDLSSADEVVDYVKRIRTLMKAIGVCHGDMEKGQLRIDANVSVRRPGEPLGTRVEIKNMNSTRFLHQAINYEVQRQIHTLKQGDVLCQETRTFDTVTGTTKTMRTKETADDYCYFPDPDLYPIVLDPHHIEELKKHLPETPAQKKRRYIDHYKLTDYDADVLTQEQEVSEFFTTVMSCVQDNSLAKPVVNWIMGDLFALYNKAELIFSDQKIPAQTLATLIQRIHDGTISNLAAKDVLNSLFEKGGDVDQTIEELGLQQENNQEIVNQWIVNVMTREPEKVQEYRQGKDKLLGYFVGQVMKESQGSANPKMLNDLVRQKLGEED